MAVPVVILTEVDMDIEITQSIDVEVRCYYCDEELNVCSVSHFGDTVQVMVDPHDWGGDEHE